MSSSKKQAIGRNANGRFKQGSSGNPLGRPHRAPRPVTPLEAREDFLDLLSSPLTITEGGKRKTVTASQALDRKQLALALNGNRICIQQIKAREERYGVQIFAEVTDLFEQVITGDRVIRERPDDVTDDYVELIRQARITLNYYLGAKKDR